MILCVCVLLYVCVCLKVVLSSSKYHLQCLIDTCLHSFSIFWLGYSCLPNDCLGSWMSFSFLLMVILKPLFRAASSLENKLTDVFSIV